MPTDGGMHGVGKHRWFRLGAPVLCAAALLVGPRVSSSLDFFFQDAY
ncbi:MAG: hypothetical protein QOG30_3419, partial [Acidimicrobiaceae bacterium]